MKFLVISQRAIPNSNFRLNDLTGHGRIDIIMRCILATCRPLVNGTFDTIYCYLKGSDNQEDNGWLEWKEKIENQDEVSIAAEIKKRWNSLFFHGTLSNLLSKLQYKEMFYLHENGQRYQNFEDGFSDSLIVLGAQTDLTQEDLDEIQVEKIIKISDTPMLASHVISLFRQLNQ